MCVYAVFVCVFVSFSELIIILVSKHLSGVRDSLFSTLYIFSLVFNCVSEHFGCKIDERFASIKSVNDKRYCVLG